MRGSAFGVDAIVIDPAVPMVAQIALERIASRAARRGSHAVPPGSAVPFPWPAELPSFRADIPKTAPPPPRVASPDGLVAGWSAFGTVVFFGAALIAAAAGSLPAVVVFLLMTAVTTAVCARKAVDARRSGWRTAVTDPKKALGNARVRQWYARHGGAYYHRQYVQPPEDFDRSDMGLWKRAFTAAAEIRDSEVVKRRYVDSAQVLAAVPQRVWDIAQGLARLREVRARQQTTVGGAAASDRNVAVKMREQGQLISLASGRISRRVKDLEEFAAMLAKADEAVRGLEALEQLGAVDDMLTELLATTDEQPGDRDQAERLRGDAQAVIDQAIAAAQRFADLSDGQDPGDGQDPDDGQDLGQLSGVRFGSYVPEGP